MSKEKEIIRGRGDINTSNTDARDRFGSNDLDLLSDLQSALLDSPSYHRATPSNSEDVLNGHEEGLVNGPLWLWDLVVEGPDQSFCCN